MGYEMSQAGCSFTIKNVHHAAVLRALKQMMLKGNSYAWVDSDAASWKTLECALRAWRWEPSYNSSLDIVKLDFVGEKLGDERVLFSKLAPFVQSGSYIEMIGEDGARWRWVFEQGDVVEKPAKIGWD